MAKIELKGIFTIVNPMVEIDAVGEKFKLQEVLFRVAGYVDDFGDKKGKDEDWPLSVFGDKIAALDLIGKQAVGKKAILTVYVNPKTWFKKEDTKRGTPMHSINGTIGDVKFVD